jgi:sacsin
VNRASVYFSLQSIYYIFDFGQKELIQNADDAGAREVKFLYDDRSFGKTYLATEHLQKYQGPALYAFNDAIFEPEDWEGIQNLMRSNKKFDLLKVGRFGIGFNSVYHITGLCY